MNYSDSSAVVVEAPRTTVGGGRSNPGVLLHDLLPTLPAGGLVAFWILSCFWSGAYFASAWYPAAIAVVVTCPLLLTAGWRLPVGGTRIALILLAAFVAWTAASIAWADAGGHALEATNKLLLALSSAFVFAITPWNERRASWLLGLLAGGIAIASLTTLLSAALATNPAGSFIDGRYSEPLGYAGASAAFAALAVWPALALSARRSSPLWLRAAMFAVAVTQVEIAVLPQSRGVVIGLALSAPLFVLLASSRGWAILRIAVASGITAISIGPILDVYTAANEGGSVAAALDDAVTGLALAAGAALLLGALLALLEERRPKLVGTTMARRIRISTIASALLAVAVAAAVYGGSASSEISDRWAAFKAGEVGSSDSTSHLTTFGDPERYDYWRVALAVTGDSPLTGDGAGNFQDAYTIRRHEEKHSRYAHSIWLRVLSETGVVGLVLLLGALGTALASVIARRRTLPPGAQLVTAGAVAASALIFTHASVDWVEEFPPILGPALALLFMAGKLAIPSSPDPPQRQAAGLVAGLAIAGIALAGLVPAYLSLRFIERAESESAGNPDAAYTDLDRAAYLNPLSAQPDLTLGGIAIARRETARAKIAFERAIEKEDNWYPHFELATLASELGRRKEALAQMKTALRLNPVDSLVLDNIARLRRGNRIGSAEVDAQIRAETSARFHHLPPAKSP
jgi:tetratricopeptide (TPR) repeat protein